jgi:hypothetical protein
MKQTAIEWLCSQIYTIQVELECGNNHLKNKIEQAKEIEKKQQLELIQFLADREDFKENSSISIFIAEDYLNQFKNK